MWKKGCCFVLKNIRLGTASVSTEVNPNNCITQIELHITGFSTKPLD